MATSEKKTFASPDKSFEVDKGVIDLVSLGGITLAHGKAEPGWKWSDNAKPTVMTDSCRLFHHGWVVSGTMKYVMDDGTELVFSDGDAFAIAPGHDAWVEGDKPFEYIEIISPVRLLDS